MTNISYIHKLSSDKSLHRTSETQNKPAWLSATVLDGLMRAGNCLVVVAAAFLAHATRFGPMADITSSQLILIILSLMPAVYLPISAFNCVTDASIFRMALNILKRWAIVPIVLVCFVFATRTGGATSRTWIALWFLYGLVGLVGIGAVFNHETRRWRRLGFLVSNIVVVGAGDVGHRLTQCLARAREPSVQLIGVFYDYEAGPADGFGGSPATDARDDLLRFARSHQIDQAIVALPWDAENRLLSWMKTLRTLPVDILLCPPVLASWLSPAGAARIGGIPLLKVSERPLSGWSYVVKAIEDRVLALLLLLIAGPMMLVIALLVRLDSPGSILFRQKRYGFNNSVIEILKFRTMFADMCEPGFKSITQATRNDPRVTRVGRWLRRTSLDELPQLFNVLCGQMSLVGPRPHAIVHNEQYQRTIEAYLARHRVKPGITGWAQVNGLRGETDTDEKMTRRVEYDLYYIDHWSLLFDLKIIARTAFIGFAHSNAY